MNKQLRIMLGADGFDTFADAGAPRGSRSCSPHYYVSKDAKNTRLYVPAKYAGVFGDVGDAVTIGYSSTSGNIVLAPEDAGLSKPRPVGDCHGSRFVTLSAYHDALRDRFGVGSVPVDLEKATTAGVPVVVVRPRPKGAPCVTA